MYEKAFYFYLSYFQCIILFNIINYRSDLMKSSYNVQPIRSQEELQEFKWSLDRYCNKRDFYLFVFGINTGLRISDILPLKVKDVKNKYHIHIVQRKNKKPRTVKIGHFSNITEDYIRNMKDDDFLFGSRKGNSHISSTQAYRTLVKAGKMIDRYDIGTHTMRKTFGYHHYKRNKDVATLQEIFSHSSPDITKRYIGITQEELDDSIDFVL